MEYTCRECHGKGSVNSRGAMEKGAVIARAAKFTVSSLGIHWLVNNHDPKSPFVFEPEGRRKYEQEIYPNFVFFEGGLLKWRSVKIATTVPQRVHSVKGGEE